MKKVFITVVALLALATSSFASNKYDVLIKLNEPATSNAVARYLGVGFNEKDQLKSIFSISEAKIKRALETKDEKAAEKALIFNLANVKAVLSQEQYQKYLTLLNVTAHNNSSANLMVKE
ncbi:hypothetical protein [Parabacteroides sp. Marseille-P3160]|uniref:hypothetical protein n=1 Tax=Parabacteroides sp. Marseille-P3160 TaxID=1917887 RepID=UPI0009BA3A9D|nr:hypothetical protein [Parabacteroides sp. Marseille-P3160]